MKKKEYEGKEIIVDETDKHIKSITFLYNGVTLMIEPDTWKEIKKELLEALKD